MSPSKQPTNYDVRGYADFRKRAADSSLSVHEKIGFPDEYRAGKAPLILADIESKITNLRRTDGCVLDIGAGCSDLPAGLIDLCAKQRHRLVLVDSSEMLDLLPDRDHVVKVRGSFPGCFDQIASIETRYSGILIYSVIQYVFAESSIWAFVDTAASLLADGGQMLIGDIPNASFRKRFLSSEAGEAYHRAHFDPQTRPQVQFNNLEIGAIDDSLVLAIVAHLRASGFDAFVLPQSPDLPMANRREDVLVRKP